MLTNSKLMKAFINLAILLGASSVWAQNNLSLDAIPTPDPAAQEASFVLDENLEINLFASDPMIAKPVGMNWDAQGRLWVVSSRLYPHIKPGQRSDDQVIVLEDRDRDGKADKSTVFAEDLLIPTGILPGDGGVYVANSTEMLFLEDTDGDLREDRRRVMLSGFGTEDTHHIIHSFRGGPEGLLYFNQSIYIHSHVETPHGVRRLMAGGIWHFRPETMELEVFARGFVNSWGHAWNRYGQSFATDGAYGEGINYVFPGSTFVTAYNAKRLLRGLNPGQPKQCGLEVIDSTHFPEDWQGNMITNDFRGHRVNRFVVSESGSGYTSRQAPDLIRTTHGAFRPIDVKIGPDGALYIADWYNPIIQHGEVDFRDPRRDHVHGRIWRVTYKGRPLSPRPEVTHQPLEKIADQLRSKDGLTRHFAKRALREAPQDAVLPVLKEMLANVALSEDKLELLWAHQAVNHLHEPLLRELLADDDHRVRAAAVRVLYHWHDQVEDALSLLEVAVGDAHPQVRLEAVNALRNKGGQPAFELAMGAYQQEVDENIDFALWLTARELEKDWLPALEAGDLSLTPMVLQFVLTAAEKPEAIRFLYESYQEAEARNEDTSALAALFAEVGDAAALDILYADALTEPEVEAVDAGLARLVEAVTTRKVQPTSLEPEKLVLLIEKGIPNALLLGGAWKLEDARAAIEKQLGEQPKVVIRALTYFGDGAAATTLQGITADLTHSPATRAAAVAGLAAIDLEAGAAAGAAWLASANSEESADRVLNAFLSQKQGPAALSAALEEQEKPLASEVATATVQQAGTSGGETTALVASLSKWGELKPITQGLTPDEMKAFVGKVREHGDPARGERVYRREALACQTCHAIGGGGGAVGPDMLSVGSSAPVDYIVDSLLEPNKKIKEGYHTTVLTTKTNEVITGGLVRESDDEIVLRLADGSEQTVKATALSKKEIIPISLMPPGLTASLREDELVDLVRFLSELGKEGPYKVPANRFVRRWRVLPYDDNVSHWIRRNGSQAMLGRGEALPWRSAYSTVAGQLPLSEIGINKGFNNDLSFAKFDIDVAAAGEIGLRIANPQGLQVLVGDTQAAAKEVSTIALEKGRHAVVLIMDRAVRRAGDLQVELIDIAGSSARASLVMGL